MRNLQKTTFFFFHMHNGSCTHLIKGCVCSETGDDDTIKNRLIKCVVIKIVRANMLRNMNGVGVVARCDDFCSCIVFNELNVNWKDVIFWKSTKCSVVKDDVAI